MPGGEQTVEVLAERLNGFRELVLSKLNKLEGELAKNSKDTAATKKLLVGILVSVVLGFVATALKGCF